MIDESRKIALVKPWPHCFTLSVPLILVFSVTTKWHENDFLNSSLGAQKFEILRGFSQTAENFVRVFCAGSLTISFL